MGKPYQIGVDLTNFQNVKLFGHYVWAQDRPDP